MEKLKNQIQQAEEFLALHHSSSIFILPNAWDVISAKIFETEGFRAIGTTSAGISATLGYADGENMSLSENLSTVRRIVNNTSLPVSADIEAGYASSAEGAARSAESVLAAGAVGINIEDSLTRPVYHLMDMEYLKEKIIAIREMSKKKKIHLVINARTDIYLINENNRDCLDETIRRGNTYTEAGADCIFIPDNGNLDSKTIKILVKEIEAPINIIAGETSPPISELQDLGVRRVSVGPRPMRAVLSLLKDISKELMEKGTYTKMINSKISYSDINNWFKENSD